MFCWNVIIWNHTWWRKLQRELHSAESGSFFSKQGEHNLGTWADIEVITKIHHYKTVVLSCPWEKQCSPMMFWMPFYSLDLRVSWCPNAPLHWNYLLPTSVFWAKSREKKTWVMVWKVRGVSFRLTNLIFTGTCYDLLEVASCCHLFLSCSEMTTLKNIITWDRKSVV